MKKQRNKNKIDTSAYFELKAKITVLEQEIGQASTCAQFADPAFSEYYDTKIAEIEKLQKQVKAIEREWDIAASVDKGSK